MRRAARWLFIDRPTLGLLLCVGVMTLGGLTLLAQREDDRARDEGVLDAKIVKASRAACFRANRTRESVRALIDQRIRETRKQIHESRTTDYSDLFPDVSAERLQMLIDKQIRSLTNTIEDPETGLLTLRHGVRNAPCRKLYPEVRG